MRAIVYHRYGSPDVLQCTDVPNPTPADDEVLLKIRAASINPYDWHFLRGTPYLLRLMAGFPKPKDPRLGADVAGTVEAVGKNVTRLKLGDEVFGVCRGAFAEYACASESKLVDKPENITFEQAASVPIAALTALQALRDKGQLQPGQKVLINGASGGVGTFAVQIANSFGAHVTAVCSTKNLDRVRSIGADKVVDYTKEDFTKIGDTYDLILDCIGNHSLFACKRVLNPKGILVTAGGDAGRWMIGPLVRNLVAFVLSLLGSQKLVGILAKVNKEDLAILRDLLASGKIAPVIDKRYRLSEVPDAIRYVETGHARGKVIVSLN